MSVRTTPIEIDTAIDELAAAIDAGAAQDVARAAHGLKGSAAVVGAERLSQIAAQLCDEATEGRLDDACRRHDELQAALELTRNALTTSATAGHHGDWAPGASARAKRRRLRRIRAQSESQDGAFAQ